MPLFTIQALTLNLSINVPAALVERLADRAFTFLTHAKADIMNELETLTTEVSETRGVMQSAKTLIEGFSARLTAALGNPAALQALADDLNSNTNELAAAITANPLPTDPQAPSPAPQPDPNAPL